MTYRQRVSKIRAYVPCLFLKDSNTSSGLFGLAPSRKLIVYMFFEVIHRKITLWIINTAEDCTRMHILMLLCHTKGPTAVSPPPPSFFQVVMISLFSRVEWKNKMTLAPRLTQYKIGIGEKSWESEDSHHNIEYLIHI